MGIHNNTVTALTLWGKKASRFRGIKISPVFRSFVVYNGLVKFLLQMFRIVLRIHWSKIKFLRSHLLNLRNYFDYFLRNSIPFSRPLKDQAETPPTDKLVQIEFRQFLDTFDWKPIFKRLSADSLQVADIGARNFLFAPVIDDLLIRHERNGMVHGIECDSFRMLWGFRTRKDYGEFYARKARQGQFHALDFMKWKTPLDLAFLLHPFVSEDPLLAWGLPRSLLKPEALFKHLAECVRPRKGVVILSSPSEDEYNIALELAEKAGLVLRQKTLWEMGPESVQSHPRFGACFY